MTVTLAARRWFLPVNTRRQCARDQSACRSSSSVLRGSAVHCRVSFTSRKSVGRTRACFREVWARALPQTEEPSYCRRRATATRGIRSSAAHRPPSRNQCHWRITRTSANQFPVSWNSGGGSGEGRKNSSHTMVHMTSGTRRFRAGVLACTAHDGSGGFHPSQGW